jgi:hypothetical protein
VYGLGLRGSVDQIVAKNVIGLGLGTAFRFWSYRTWVFRALPVAQRAMEEAEEILATAEKPALKH